ncbi:MAG: single-stranded DNA-binding protein, partial [Tissierellia bacterium]|nr:single-stranded DNA-binding protein [Tissierellia bacterium]
EYMENDTQGLLNDEFDYAIDNLKEQGLLKEDKTETDRDDLINIVGNLVKEPEMVEIRDNKNESLQVANFTIVSNDENGKKNYHRCSAYADKSKDVENYKQGDFVKIFGQAKTTIGDDGKEYTNIRILSSKLLKAKEQSKDKLEKKESILGAMKRFKEEGKEKSGGKSDKSRGNER